jgi:GNAT superfamily N-acetyltransferase
MTSTAAPLEMPYPDETLESLAGGKVHARCSLWWRETPLHHGRRTGFIGAVSSSDDDALAALLARAAERLRGEGCALATGPIDGNTWHRYRLVTCTDGTPPFPLEPHSPLTATLPWERAGFTSLETYSSLRDDALGKRDPRVPALAAKLRENGVTLRALNLQRFDEELAQIHALALRGFRDAPLFTPIEFAEFASLYRPLAPLLDARLCPLAEVDGRIGAALFAFRDPRAPQTVVLKTVVRDADRRLAGIGFVLTDAVRAAAHALGALRAISALQHDGTVARSLAGRAVVFRRYAVFSKELS